MKKIIYFFKIKKLFFQNIRFFIKYIRVGIFINLIGYLLYLFGTYIGLAPIKMMTILYTSATISSYILNKKYTFNLKGKFKKTFIKFIFVNLSAYLINFLFLYYFTKIIYYPHELVQFFAMFFIGSYLFILSRYFIFKQQ